MKIAFLTTIAFPYQNASNNRIITLAKGFVFHGLQSEVICISSNLNKEYSLSPEGNYNTVNYRYLLGTPYRSNNFIKRRYKKIKGLILGIFYIYSIRKEKTSLIAITQFSWRFLILNIICNIYKINTYLEICEYPLHKRKKKLRLNSPMSFIRKMFYLSFTGYIFETNRLYTYYKDYLGKINKSIVVPSTMEYDDIINKERDNDRKYIAYCGSISSEEKDGLLFIIKSFALMINNVIDVKLYCVGKIMSNDYYSALKKLILQLNLEDKVFFSGEVTRAEYVDYLVNASALVVAKGKNSFFNGGLSSKVVEYLFAKVPVVLTDADDFSKYLLDKRDVFFVENDNTEELSKVLQQLLQNQLLADTISNNGFKRAFEIFDYRKLSLEIIDFID